VKNDAAINCEKSLRTNEALMAELAAFKIGAIQRNGESIGMRAAGDLAENQILAWKIVDYQNGPALSAGGIGPRKRYDNDPRFQRSLRRLKQRHCTSEMSCQR